MIPAVLLRIHTRLEFRRSSRRSRPAAARQFETLLDEHVEGLLQEGVLQEEPGGVPLRLAVVGIPALVQRLPEDAPTQIHLAAHQDPRQFPELDVGQAVLAELEAAAVAHRDDSSGFVAALAAYGLDQAVQEVLLGLSLQAFSLAEALGQHHVAVPQKIQNVPEEDTVAVEEVTIFRVPRDGLATREDGVQLGVRLARQRL